MIELLDWLNFSTINLFVIRMVDFLAWTEFIGNAFTSEPCGPSRLEYNIRTSYS